MRTLWSGLAVLAVAASSASCITQRCLRDADCTAGLVCRLADGACAEPECTTGTECGVGRICEQRFCVAGCLDDDDCAAPEQCVERRCRTLADDCRCPLAPAACRPDQNPRSATAGTEVCVPRDYPEGAALFFGSVFCGHCTANLRALWQRKLELEAEGFRPQLIWVQLGRATAGPDSVGSIFDEAWDFPVLQDDPEGTIWQAFGADWYHFVIVDAHGCTDAARHFGPIDPTMVLGERGDAMVDVWRAALSGQCIEATADAGD